MSVQLEASKAEQKSLVMATARQKQVTSGMNAHNMEDILWIEDKLSAQVCHLQQQMDKAKADARSCEEELLKEIELLQSQETHVLQPLFPVDGSIAEESMELATPLQPTMLLSMQSHNTPPEPIDPSLIPLPFSPV
ncbi:hypothetical protein BKA82DRAFT_4348091 [Pisolithus tinctorius]|nr:hypothetical protein BKA82DRAFT_4348091 [Pisolithus tinctorius]